MGIHPDRLVLPPITQHVVDLGERAFVIAPIHLVGDGQVFVGMDVMKGNRAGFTFGRGVLQALATERNEDSGDAAAATEPGQTEGQRLFVRDRNRHVPPPSNASVCSHPDSKRRGRRVTHCDLAIANEH